MWNIQPRQRESGVVEKGVTIQKGKGGKRGVNQHADGRQKYRSALAQAGVAECRIVQKGRQNKRCRQENAALESPPGL